MKGQLKSFFFVWLFAMNLTTFRIFPPNGNMVEKLFKKKIWKLDLVGLLHIIALYLSIFCIRPKYPTCTFYSLHN